jgi:ABC-2 type transport system ATP-binding protein
VLGTERVLLRVRGDADGLDETVKKVKGTRKVETRPEEAVEFEFSAGQDVRPQVAKAVVQAGYELLEMRPVGMSLEEIFLELTEDKTSTKVDGKWYSER